MHLYYLHGMLSFYFAKVTNIIKVTNSLQSVDYNVYIRERYS
jgi:hypothetical protein